MKRWLSALALLAVTAGFTANASAAECEGVKFPDTVTVDGQKLVLNGLGMREATIFNVDVYVAGIYVTQKSKSSKELLDTSKPIKFVMKFVRDVDKSDVAGAYKESFEKAPKATQKKLKPEFDKLLSWMSGIKKGQEMEYTYTPGKGMEVKVKGKVKGVIKGADTTQFFLNIWLGPKPPNKGLKAGLLGGKCG
ncbi:chalcone isomerase family protein [Bradymonas sediminis]|uniref:Uncharacterized protein n=1 Tax=Bradymonas sediminis TaxID=1548548 RepID=A0A2Z4FQ68_9DELT|nr:chalcone isomerase family protein [Bradymonas sediminis]AWV90808.1 hypothetical protein DN745_16375 [Bradymonas sediminis]TDP75458.1 chalcone isomerase-like protein [Bradymonas sediminis]